MSDLKICRICLSTQVKVYNYKYFQLKSYYEEVMGAKVNDINDTLPHYFCYECAMMVHKFHKFKERCYCGQKVLKEMLWKGPITYERVYRLDRITKNLISPIQMSIITARVKSFVINEDDNDQNSQDDQLDDYDNVEIDLDILEDSDNSFDFNFSNPNSPVNVFIDEDEGIVKLENSKIKERKKTQATDDETSSLKRQPRDLNNDNWKIIMFSDEEALKEFRQRAEDEKYVKANFKCTDCFRGFSKKDMLSRHVQLRHAESLGEYECRFCRVRVKWASALRIHTREHFTKYQCLLCDFTCQYKSSALFHEDFHNGITRKCMHCDEEFKHPSTYYSHLRTVHRSVYLCNICGVSFVSEAGLHQHKKLKHIAEMEQSDEDDDNDEELNTYCEQCRIKFETRKAYEEHIFHSAMHADDLEDETADEVATARKVYGKRLRAKIIKKQLKDRRKEIESLSIPNAKRRRRRRLKRKPMTCHQCGRHFETQNACRKHHLAEHPGTSFYAPNERHICEICGASLAPGSVATHQNMHTREIVHECHFCGREFHSVVGLKRHLVTHTGEKNFPCTLCEKRFTQSNSRKLHYKTFHLNQPYPKRNRRKKQDNQVYIEDSSGDSVIEVPEDPSRGQDVETSHYTTLD